MSTVTWQEAALPPCHPSQQVMPSSTECTEQAHSPVAAGKTMRNALTHRYITMSSTYASQNWPFPWRIWIPSNIRFLGPTSQPPNSISIGSVVFAQLTLLPNTYTQKHRRREGHRDIKTHRPWCVRHLEQRATSMHYVQTMQRPNNK